ncbi:hypothetical protein [Micromonospora sp. NPDC005652]|uniref:hypothetical protein n=1 Tax=Micromonospora sp. NPDC005652 TaxID=3157046 RepID=UPI0033C4E331
MAIVADTSDVRERASARITRCRYLKGPEGDPVRCTGEVADPDAELLLCPRHLAMSFRMFTALTRRAA